MTELKPLGRKSYGSIPHLPGSRLGPGDHCVSEGQARICTEQVRDKHDLVIVQEKLDGSNVAVALHEGQILALGRAGYLAQSSRWEQHQLFAYWVRDNEQRFRRVLKEGERLCGEWLAQAHGTRYDLRLTEPFVAFDLMHDDVRLRYFDFTCRLEDEFEIPRLIWIGGSFSIPDALEAIQHSGHGALDPVEGAVWRVEREGKVDFLAKYVRHDKKDGCYLESETGKPAVWNWRP
jgi:hypothetical protein